jgi:hypothetical protein
MRSEVKLTAPSPAARAGSGQIANDQNMRWCSPGPRGQQRRSKTELWREFDIARPRILGDAAVRGLQTWPDVGAPAGHMPIFIIWVSV